VVNVFGIPIGIKLEIYTYCATDSPVNSKICRYQRSRRLNCKLSSPVQAFGVVGSNPTRIMDVCLYSAFVSSYVRNGTATV
jgi:hypothetical protein